MDYGVTKRIMRAKLPVDVPRGFSPTEPTKLSSLAPPIDGEAIYSGMLLVKATGLVNGVSTTGAFRKAEVADAAVQHQSFYIALHDQDSHDAQAAGGIVGLDCSDDYEIKTGYYDSGITWVVGDPVTADADGVITEAATGDYIVGYVTKIGAAGAGIAYVGKTPSATDPLTLQFKTAANGVKVVA